MLGQIARMFRRRSSLEIGRCSDYRHGMGRADLYGDNVFGNQAAATHTCIVAPADNIRKPVIDVKLDANIRVVG